MEMVTLYPGPLILLLLISSNSIVQSEAPLLASHRHRINHLLTVARALIKEWTPLFTNQVAYPLSSNNRIRRTIQCSPNKEDWTYITSSSSKQYSKTASLHLVGSTTKTQPVWWAAISLEYWSKQATTSSREQTIFPFLLFGEKYTLSIYSKHMPERGLWQYSWIITINPI